MISQETLWSFISGPSMLAVAALLAYWVGRRKLPASARNRADNRHEILRALAVAQELEAIAYRLQKSLSAQVPEIVRFNSRLARLEHQSDLSWHELCDRADAMLKPTLRLGTEISHAYSELLQQMTHLSSFAELRTDPLTNVSNRRTFDETLATSLSQQARYDVPLSVAMIDIDRFKTINDEQGHLQGDRILQEMAHLLRSNVRECDLLARYGGEEFVVLMPQTDGKSACVLAERLRICVQAKLSVTISIGLAASLRGDGSESLLARADAALYKAKGAGRNRVFLHEGPEGTIVPVPLVAGSSPAPSTEPVPSLVFDDVEPQMLSLSHSEG